MINIDDPNVSFYIHSGGEYKMTHIENSINGRQAECILGKLAFKNANLHTTKMEIDPIGAARILRGGDETFKATKEQFLEERNIARILGGRSISKLMLVNKATGNILTRVSDIRTDREYNPDGLIYIELSNKDSYQYIKEFPNFKEPLYVSYLFERSREHKLINALAFADKVDYSKMVDIEEKDRLLVKCVRIILKRFRIIRPDAGRNSKPGERVLNLFGEEVREAAGQSIDTPFMGAIKCDTAVAQFLQLGCRTIEI